MYTNFGVPRNGFRGAVGSSQAAWPLPHSAYPHFPQDLQYPPHHIFGDRPPGGSRTDEIADEELMSLLSKYQCVGKSTEKSPKINVSTVAQLLAEYKRLIKSVESSVKYLEVTKKTLSEEDWIVKRQELDHKKDVLLEIEKQLSDPAFTELVSRTVKRVKAKRERIKRKKAAWRVQKKELREIREEKHKKIDLWLEKMKDEVERAQRAETVKKEADLVLSEVTLKRNEAKRVLGLLNSLTKLRNAKLQQLSANKKVSEEETKSFNSVIEKLKNMWASQLKEYNLEEQGLKVMLEDAEAERVNVQEKTWKQNLHLWTEALFGVRSIVDPLQAQPSDFGHFTSIRNDWDTFVSPEDSMLSSNIPCGWVMPTKPSSSEWATFLEGAAPQ